MALAKSDLIFDLGLVFRFDMSLVYSLDLSERQQRN